MPLKVVLLHNTSCTAGQSASSAIAEETVCVAEKIGLIMVVERVACSNGDCRCDQSKPVPSSQPIGRLNSARRLRPPDQLERRR
jgi:hypothetical protein